MPKAILHIDLDAFFVSVEQAANPALKGKAVVVGGNPEGRGVVASASYEARAYGIHAAMPLKTARRLCPPAIFLEADFPRYRAASHRFMSILADLTPSLEPAGLEEAYLDVTDLNQGSPLEIARRLKDRVRRELDLTASVGIASGKIVAKIASGRCKPDGLLEIPPGGERGFLAPLPVSELPGVGRKTAQALAAMGIVTIGRLAEASLSVLRQTFGVAGESLHRHANGIDESKVEIPGPAKSFSGEITFEKDTRDVPFLEAVLHHLSERVGAELRQDDRRARCVTLKVRYADFSTIARSRTVREAVDTDQIIFRVGRELLEKALAEQRKPLRLLGLRVSGLVEGGRQLSLLDSRAEKLRQLNQAMDHINRKYGAGALFSGWALRWKEGG